MVCPKCTREMEEGFLQCDHKSNITWVSKLLPFGLGFWKSEAEVISDHKSLGVVAVPAHICKNCRVFFGDYSAKE